MSFVEEKEEAAVFVMRSNSEINECNLWKVTLQPDWGKVGLSQSVLFHDKWG